MPFSSGVFNRVYNWVNDKNASINITASRMDTETDGIATGLSTCVLKDGTQTITADLPMAGFKFTGLGAGTANTDSATIGQLQNNAINWIAGGGTADVITATYSPAVTALVDGMELSFRASAANATTTPTFSPNGLTAHTITKNGGSALVAGDIRANLAEYKVRYNLANTRWELTNPSFPMALTGGVTTVGNAATVVTNANLTGLVTSVGNATTLNLSPITNSISGNVSLNNTGNFFDGPSVAQGTSGTWFASGTVTLTDTATAASFLLKLWDGTTNIATAYVDSPTANKYITVALSGYIASPAGNIRISVKDQTATTGLIGASVSGVTKDSTITAIRIA